LQHPKILNSCGCVCVSIVNQSTISNSLSSKLGPNRKKLGTTPHTFGWFWLVYQHLSESVDCFRHTHTQTYLYPLSSLVGVIWMELEDRIGDKLSQTFGLFVLPGQELLLLFYCGLCLPLSLSLSLSHSFTRRYVSPQKQGGECSVIVPSLCIGEGSPETFSPIRRGDVGDGIKLIHTYENVVLIPTYIYICRNN
jgi:hypothetical protein